MAYQAIAAVVAKVWAVIKVVAAVYSIYTAWSMSNKGNQSPTYGWNIETQCSNELPVPIIYGGPNKVGGNIVWQKTSDDNKELYMLVAIAEGEIESIEDVRANDIPFSELEGSSYNIYLGTKTQELDLRCGGTWVDDQGHWTYDDDGYMDEWIVDVPAHWEGDWRNGIEKAGSLRNVAYIALTIRASDKISGYRPNITAVVKGKKVRVWENDAWTTKYSDNPAWCLLDLLTNFRYGGGYLDSQIDIETFKSAAMYCDEQILVDDGTEVSNKPRFTIGLVIDWQASLPDIADQIRMACRGYIASRNGQVSFKIEQPEMPVQDFTMDHIVPNSLQIALPGKDDVWELVQVTYVDPEQNYAKIPAQSIDESNPIFPTKKEFTIVAVNRFDQASRLAYFYRVYSKLCGQSGKFKTTIRALNRTAGDVITLTEDVMGWVKKPVRIFAIRHADDHTQEIYWREYNETIYTDALGGAKPTINYSERPNPFAPPPEPTDLVLEESSFILKSGEVVTEIDISFTPGRNMFYSHTEVLMSENDSDVWKNVGPAIDGSLSVHGLKIGVKYTFKLKTVTQSGIKSNGVIQSVTTVGKDRPPSDVSSITAVQNEYNRAEILLSWPAIDATLNPDLRGYEVRVGQSWDTGTKVGGLVYGLKTSHAVTEGGNYIFWVKAQDNSGGYSTNAAKAEINVIVKPDTPAAGSAEQDPKDATYAIISWDEVNQKDIASYEIRQGNDWDSASVVASTKETSYRVKLESSGTYNFMVRTQNIAGYLSNALNISLTASIEPADVTGFSVTQQGSDHSKLRFTWDKPEALDIAYFEIREGNTWDAGAIVATNITGLFFEAIIEDEGAKTYWIKAVNVGGIYSQFPAEFSGIFNLNPSAPSNLTITQDPNDKSVIIITWSGVEELDINEYELWQSEQLIAKTKETKTTWTPPASGDYRFVLKAKNNAGFYSDEVITSYYAILEPTDVSAFTAVQNGASVLMVWTKSVEVDVVGYEIREGGSFDNGSLVATGIGGTTYQVAVDTETTKRYHIKAINRSGRYSQNAASASVTITNLPPKNVIYSWDESNLLEPFTSSAWNKASGITVLSGTSIQLVASELWRETRMVYNVIPNVPCEFGAKIDKPGYGMVIYELNDGTRSFLTMVENAYPNRTFTPSTSQIMVVFTNSETGTFVCSAPYLRQGTHSNTEFGESLINFSNLGGRFSDYPDTKFSEIGGQTVLKLKSGVQFARNSTAYKSDGVMVEANKPRIEGMTYWYEGTTNLLTPNQASMETDTTGFVATKAGITIVRDTNEKYQGNASLKTVTDGTATLQGICTTSTAITAGQTYTASAWIKGSGNLQFVCGEYDNSGNWLAESQYNFTPSSMWQRVSVTRTIVTGTQARIQVRTVNTAQSVTFYCDGFQLEQKPYATDFVVGTRETVYETLPYGKCVMVEEGTTNLYQNPKMDSTTGWVALNSATLAITSSPPGQLPSGVTSCMSATCASGQVYVGMLQSFTLPVNTTYTLSMWVYVPSAIPVGASRLTGIFNSWNAAVNYTIPERDVWVKKTFTFTTSDTYTDYRVGFFNEKVTAGITVYACLAQLEQKSYPTSLTIGTRQPESLTMPTAGLSPTQGTIEGIVEITDTTKRQVSGQEPRLFNIPSADGGISCRGITNNNWRFSTQNSSGATGVNISQTLTSTGWYYCKIYWTTALCKIEFWNLSTKTKVSEGVVTNPQLPSAFQSNLFIGSYDGINHFLNARFGKHRLSNIARTADPDFSNLMPSDEHTLAVLDPDNGLISYYREGAYVCQQKDMGSVITANISSQFVSSVLLSSGVSASLQYRISQDGTTWTDWRNFAPIQATFRYLEFRVLLATVDVTKTPEVNTLTETVDVPDTDKYGIATIAVGGTDVAFGHTYWQTPVVMPTTIGQGLRAELVSVAKDKFRVRVLDLSGTDVGGQINWISRGF